MPYPATLSLRSHLNPNRLHRVPDPCRKAWRWCMNMAWVAFPPHACVLFDTDGDRHTEAGHPVEGVAGDFGFGPLIGQTSGMKTPANDGLVAIHRGLHEAAPAVSRATLP